MKNLRLLITLVLVSLAVARSHGQEVHVDSLPSLSGNWVQQLYAAHFDINDPRIDYPKFPNFIRKVYNWGDRVFNTYDKNYVVGTGKNWKASIKSQNWMQSYVYDFSIFKDNTVALRTGIYSDFGISLNFMALSVGYTWNVNRWFADEHDKRNTFNFSFTTALFSAEFTTSSNDTRGRLSRLGSSSDAFNEWRRNNSVPVSQNSLNFNAYYFFNHRRYSQAAAYCFSKYQLRSAGTWLLGFDYNHQSIDIDFTVLPPELREEVPDLPLYGIYRYRDFNLMGGYAHNFVLPHNWLINLTVLPSIGYKRMPHQMRQTHREMLSLASIVKSSVTYNHRGLFAAMQFNFDGDILLTSHYAFFNSTEAFTWIVGVRF